MKIAYILNIKIHFFKYLKKKGEPLKEISQFIQFKEEYFFQNRYIYLKV